jgi:mannose-6-phosphate isomerase-like protein (cupin superfamily)
MGAYHRGMSTPDPAPLTVVSIAEKLAQVREFWSPVIVGDVNDMQVKLVKLRGEFVWHHHQHEDELFLVVAGRLRMRLRDGDREVGPGEFLVVPRGVEHCPLALTEEVHVLLLEPRTTLNTGNLQDDARAVPVPRRL